MRRTAAVVALLMPVAMAAVLIAALAGDLAIAALAVALLLASVAALWLALTTRGSRRVAGIALCALFAGGVGAVLATHWQGVLVLIALLLLLALFGVAARYALGRTGEAAAEAIAKEIVHVGAAGSAALIINLKSGGGKAERFHLGGIGETRDAALRAASRQTGRVPYPTPCRFVPMTRGQHEGESVAWRATGTS